MVKCTKHPTRLQECLEHRKSLRISSSPAKSMHVENMLKSGGEPYGPSTKAGTVEAEPFRPACSRSLWVKPDLPRIRNTKSLSACSFAPSSEWGMLDIVNGCASLGRLLTEGRITYACWPGFQCMCLGRVRIHQSESCI